MTDTQGKPESVATARKPLLSIAVVFIAVIGLYFAVRAMPLDALGDIRPKHLAWSYVPLVALLQLLFLWLATQIWRQVVRVLTGSHIHFWPAYAQLAVVAVGKYVPGKIWGFMARAGDMQRQQIPVQLSVMSSVIEQLLVVIGALLVMIVAALFALPEHRLAVLIAGTLLLAAAVTVAIRVPALSRYLLDRRGEHDIPDEIPEYHATGVLAFSMAYAVLWILSGLIFSVIYYSLFDSPFSIEIVAALILANTAGVVLGFFAFFVPGGIGVREAIATFVLAGFVPAKEALLAAVSYRALMVLVDGINALYILFRETAASQPMPKE